MYRRIDIFTLKFLLLFSSGLLYLGFKHLVDRYNLYFNHRAPAYKYVDSTVHYTAVTFAMISTFYLLVSLLFYSVIRLGKYRVEFEAFQNYENTSRSPPHQVILEDFFYSAYIGYAVEI